MNEPTETHCPHCGTLFRIDESLLQKAGGRVRCGSCLQVFDGRSGELEFVAPKVAETEHPNPLENINLQPMEAAELPRRPLRVVGWPWLICGLLLLALVFQYYEKPGRQQRAPLTLSDLVVRQHPERADALRVDAIIRNPGTEARPLPGLELLFSNSYGEPRAGRLFKPSDYLHPPWENLREIAARTEIQVSLTLQDPGHKVVNYSGILRTLTSDAD